MSKLKEERIKKGVTLVKMSEELKDYGLNVTPTSLARYEKWQKKDGRNPSFETWAILADYFGVSVNELMNVDDTNKQISDMADRFLKMNDKMLSAQLNRIQNTKLRPMEPSTLAFAIKLVMDLYDKYDFSSDETTEISVILKALNNMINNSIDDDDDYQNTIDDFTKLVNNLKEQNKKASD